jgi:hypothetical protein
MPKSENALALMSLFQMFPILDGVKVTHYKERRLKTFHIFTSQRL